MKKDIKPIADMVFEVSWEVCNKVGGIFTVLSSKARHMEKQYKNSYCLIGPYFVEKSRGVFKENSIPEIYKKISEELKAEGIVCHFGSWLIEGEPKVILIDFQGLWSQSDDIKKQLWDDFQLDSLNCSHDFDEPVLWSWAIGILIDNEVHYCDV